MILDVGSGEECILGEFLPNFQIVYVDPLLSLHPDRASNMIAGTAFDNYLDGKSFDYVTCVDTLEHIPLENRTAFLERISTLAKKGIIIATPCSDAGNAVETDSWLNEIYSISFGHDYKWLSEHFEYGLPSLSTTIKKLESLGLKTKVLQNGHTPWLREFLGFIICALEFPDMRPLIMQLSQYFDENLYPFDHMDPCYRQVIIATKNDLPNFTFQQKISSDDEKIAENHWEYIKKRIIAYSTNLASLQGTKLSDVIEKQSAEINKIVKDVDVLQKINLKHQNVIRDKEFQLSSLQSLLKEKNPKEAHLQLSLTEKESEITHLQLSLTEKESEITHLQLSLTEKESEITHLQLSLTEKESEITSLQTAIMNYQNIIIDIHQSFVLRLLHKYDKTIGKFIPLRPKKYVKSIAKQSTQEEHMINTQKALEPIKLTKKDIICFPIINWNYRYQRPQHIMTEFAKKGHRVFYLTVNLRKLNKSYEITQISDNIFQIELNSPKFFDIYKDVFNESFVSDIIQSFKILNNELKLDGICFVEFPTWTPLVLELKKQFNYGIIFDCLDDFTGFGNVIKEREKEEKILVQKSDLVIATSSYLLKKVMKETTKAFFLPNAGEFNHFHKMPHDRPLQDYKKPIIGYFGSIADWFDNEIIEFVAEKRPELTFVLIGHTFGSDIHKLQELKNVYFLGERPYSELPKYLYDFDVCLVPFKITPLIVSTHPVKIYEYFSAGKAVVATDIPELLPMSNLCYIAKDREDFLKKIDLALDENDKNLVQRRTDFASKNTWEQRFSDLYSKLNEMPFLQISQHK